MHEVEQQNKVLRKREIAHHMEMAGFITLKSALIKDAERLAGWAKSMIRFAPREKETEAQVYLDQHKALKESIEKEV